MLNAWVSLLAVSAILAAPAGAQSSFPSSPHTPIPSMVPSGVADSVYVDPTHQGLPTDVDVGMTLAHTWTGDLVVTLTHPMGETVTLMHRPGVPATPFGCSGDDPDVVADDEGPEGSIEDDCQGGTGIAYVPGGHYTPADALTAFDGLPATGYWTIRVSDIAGGADIGTFESWTLTLAGVAVDMHAPPDVDAPTLVVRPNPLDADGVAHLILPAPAEVRVELLDSLGRMVGTLHNGRLAAGVHALPFHAGNGGVYLLRATVAGEVITRTITVAR